MTCIYYMSSEKTIVFYKVDKSKNVVYYYNSRYSEWLPSLAWWNNHSSRFESSESVKKISKKEFNTWLMLQELKR